MLSCSCCTSIVLTLKSQSGRVQPPMGSLVAKECIMMQVSRTKKTKPCRSKVEVGLRWLPF